jgi:UDP-glucose 4-epimerase
MRALVTGGAGFIGSHVVDTLVARGDDVLVFDDLSSGRRENLAGAFEHGARLLEADITDADAVAGAFAGFEPEVVCHLAAQIDVRHSVSDPAYDLGVNAGGTINLLESSRQSGVERFVFASTGGAIYGEGEGRQLPLDEDAACLPDAPYGQSKLAAEGYLGLYRRLHGLGATALRLGNVYGPRQDPYGEAGVVAIFCTALLAGRRPLIFGDGEQTRDYVYVGDVAEAFLAATTRSADGAYNIGTGVEASVNELGRTIAARAGTEFEPEPAPARLGEVQRISIDPKRAERELGWRAAHALDRGLELTVDSFRD